jgi:hypothetical protein
VSHRKPLSLLYSVRYRRAVSLPPTSLVSHRKSLSLFLPPAAVVLGSSQLTDKKSPFFTLFDIGVLFRSRSHHLYLTESRSPFFCHWQRSSLFLSRFARYSVQNRRGASPSLAPLVFHGTSFSFLLSLAAVVLGSSQLTDKKSPFFTLFDIGVLFRSRSHPLYLTESRSPFFCHWQRSSLFLPLAAVDYLSSVRSSRLSRSARDTSQLTDKKSPFSRHWRRSFTRPLFVRLVSLAPLAILRNSQIKNLPSSATGGGRLLVLCSFVSSLSLRSRYFATHR